MDDRAELERRLRAGEWLNVAEVQTLFNVRSRSTVHRWVTAGRVRWRQAAAGEVRVWKELHPEDVLALLEERRRVHRGPEPVGGAEQR